MQNRFDTRGLANSKYHRLNPAMRLLKRPVEMAAAKQEGHGTVARDDHSLSHPKEAGAAPVPHRLVRPPMRSWGGARWREAARGGYAPRGGESE
jgi:hypothetical protein